MPPPLSLPSELTEQLVAQLGREPSVPPSLTRPVHVVYGGAHLFTKGTVTKLGERARGALEAWAGDPTTFGAVVGVTDPALAGRVFERVREKLARRPVEALCIDFEDGYGPRSDDEEDADAVRAATELAGMEPSSTAIGIRTKALSGTTVARAIRTLDLFVTALGPPPEGFTVTLPKVTTPEQVSALALLLEELEVHHRIRRRIGIELMIESRRALTTPNGELALPALLAAARGRAVAVHLGAYDLTAELGVTAADQRLDHPYCELARTLLQVFVTGTGIGVSDGASTVLPIPPKNAPADVAATAVREAWALHAKNVRHAIALGIFQGWDLHPAQLPARYGALFGHFLSQREAMTARLRSFVANATQASRVGQAFDDAATGQGLMAFFARGLACGAFDESDLGATGLTREDLARPFAEIVTSRTAGG